MVMVVSCHVVVVVEGGAPFMIHPYGTNGPGLSWPVASSSRNSRMELCPRFVT